MTTGQHTVRDIYCIKCGTTVGWKYASSIFCLFLFFRAHRKLLRYRSSPMRLARSTRRANSFSNAICLSTSNESPSPSLSRVFPGFVPLFLAPCRRSRHRHDRFASPEFLSLYFESVGSYSRILPLLSLNAGAGQSQSHVCLVPVDWSRRLQLPFPIIDIPCISYHSIHGISFATVFHDLEL